MRGTIIVNQNISNHIEYKINRFQDEFIKKGIPLDVVINDGTIASIINGKVNINLNNPDFIIYMDKDIYLARLLEKEGYRLFNRANFIKLCDDKMLTFIACSNLGINMPKTFAGPLVYYELTENGYRFLDHIADELKFPLVMKRVYGSLGEGVYLVKDKEELKTKYKTLATQPLIFQEYIERSKGFSIRVLVIDGKVVGAFKRVNNSDFRSNFGETAHSEEIVDKQIYLDFAQSISDKLHIEYAGIDVLLDKNNNPILCEINSNAFFEEFEKVTHINVGELFANMVIKKMKEKENYEEEAIY